MNKLKEKKDTDKQNKNKEYLKKKWSEMSNKKERAIKRKWAKINRNQLISRI